MTPVLPILTVYLDDREVHPDSPVRRTLPALMDVAAIEYLENRLVVPKGMVFHARVLLMRVFLHQPQNNAWSFWLHDCDEGPYMPGIHWPGNQAGDHGPVHFALGDRVDAAIKRISRDIPGTTYGTVEIRADISRIGAHQKLALQARRRQLLAAYAAQQDA